MTVSLRAKYELQTICRDSSGELIRREQNGGDTKAKSLIEPRLLYCSVVGLNFGQPLNGEQLKPSGFKLMRHAA
ncbi:MAG TPA: hypothetical protein VGC64_05300 [Pyrinomonadaceae bacterium]